MVDWMTGLLCTVGGVSGRGSGGARRAVGGCDSRARASPSCGGCGSCCCCCVTFSSALLPRAFARSGLSSNAKSGTAYRGPLPGAGMCFPIVFPGGGGGGGAPTSEGAESVAIFGNADFGGGGGVEAAEAAGAAACDDSGGAGLPQLPPITAAVLVAGVGPGGGSDDDAAGATAPALCTEFVY